MGMVAQALVTLVLLMVAAYAQLRIPGHTDTVEKVGITRLLLAAVGIAFGLAAAANFSGRAVQLMALLSGFGIVHLPAAIILYIKGRRGEGKS